MGISPPVACIGALLLKSDGKANLLVVLMGCSFCMLLRALKTIGMLLRSRRDEHEPGVKGNTRETRIQVATGQGPLMNKAMGFLCK
jgi:hypothetical protein